MEKKTRIKQKRSARTTREQLAYYQTFCKQHPVLEAKTNYLEDSGIKQRLWEQLAEDLNNLKGPSRSVHVWKKMLSDWRNLMNSLDRKLRVKRGEAGEGSSKIQIVAVEEETSQTFDSAAVEGVCLGFDEKQAENTGGLSYSFSQDMKIEPSSPVLNSETSLTSPVSKTQPSLLSTALKPESSSPLPSLPPLSSPLPSDEWTPSMTDKQPNARRSQNLKHNRLDQIYELVINNMAAEQKRMAMESQQHKMLLASNLAVQHALEKMANAFTTLAEAVTKNINNK